MKKFIVLLFFVVTLSVTAEAQISFGLKGGINFATISNYDNIDVPTTVRDAFTVDGSNSYRVGYNAGIFLNFAVAEGVVAFQPELLYSNQGMKNSGSILGESINFESTIKTDYLTIPLMIQLYVIKDVLSIEAGPQLGFLVNSSGHYKLSGTVGGISGTWEEDWDIGDNINTFDCSIAAGVGFQIPSLPIGVNARYTIGLTKVSKNDTNNKSTYNSVFQIGAFLKFGGTQ